MQHDLLAGLIQLEHSSATTVTARRAARAGSAVEIALGIADQACIRNRTVNLLGAGEGMEYGFSSMLVQLEHSSAAPPRVAIGISAA